MALEFVKKQKIWNELVTKQGSNFMQSWEWGEFRQKNGIAIFRLRINFQESKKPFGVQIEKRKLSLSKSYLYLSGANFPYSLSALKLLLQQIKNIAEKEKAIFLKIEPLREIAKKKTDQLINLGFIKAKNIQPKNSLILDITRPEEELFQSFHHKHRYNIRLAQRKGIKIRAARDNKDFEEFYQLIKKTDRRKETKSFPKKYYKELFLLSQKRAVTSSEPSLRIRFLLAFRGSQPIAGMVIIIWNRRATYLIGASDYQYRQYMAPHLLQWEAIKLAKDLGAQEYDFWGIIRKDSFLSEKEFERHPWAGITRFKQGFGGKIVSYPGAYDYVFSSTWYKLYKLGKRVSF